MTYKQRLICLLSLITVLVLVYIGSFVFSYESGNTRSASYVWLDQNTAQRTNRITINNMWEEFELSKNNDQWFIHYNDSEYPARQVRIEDFISVFTTRSSWPVRSTSASSHDRFGLDDKASRVTFYNDYSVLLDLFLGDDDIMGRETFIRKVGQNEVRSGDNSVDSYIYGPVTNWYNLRLIPESESGRIGLNNVQRLTVYNNEETQIFTRRNRVWDITGITVENPDMSSIDNFISFILNAEGEDFLDPSSAADITFDHSRFILEFDDGTVLNIRVSGPNEVNKRFAQVSNSNYTYVIPLWVSVRIFRSAESFEIQ